MPSRAPMVSALCPYGLNAGNANLGPSEIQRGSLHLNATVADAIGVQSMPSTTLECTDLTFN